MSASPMRFLIVAALAVAGILVLGNAFEPRTTGASSETPTPTPAPDESPKQQRTTEPQADETDAAEPGSIEGVLVQVFNATSTTGLAAEVQAKLEKRGAVAAAEPGNAAANAATTVLYFAHNKDRANADYIARRLFDEAEVRSAADLPQLDREVANDAEVVVVVGENYTT
jgi:hypothetical protein